MNNTPKISTVFLVIITIFAAFSMAWMEMEIDSKIGLGHRFAIASIGLGRLMLFWYSGELWGKDQSKARWVTFFSVCLFGVVLFYAENIQGIGDNVRILYHALNCVLLFMEWTLAFSMIVKGKYIYGVLNEKWEAQCNEREKEADKYKSERDQLSHWEDIYINTQAKLQMFEDLQIEVGEVKDKLKASRAKMKTYESKVIAYERIKPILNKPFMKGNTCYVIDEDTRELLSIGRGSSEVESKAGKIYTKPINGKAKTE